MSSHNDRMRNIGKWCPPDPNSLAGELLSNYVEQHQNDPKFAKEMRDIYKKCLSIMTLQASTGAGLPIDKQIREYFLEYNSRQINHTLRSLPSSFNVMEGFFELFPKNGGFTIREENDYLFQFVDFIDFITSSNDSDDYKSSLYEFDEGKIYSFNNVDDPFDFLVSLSSGEDFGIGGLSLVRHENDVCMLLLAGEVADLKKESEIILNNFKKAEVFGHRKDIKPAEDLELRAEPIWEGSNNLWKTVILIRFDIETATMDARYVFKDFGNQYSCITDDITAFLNDKGQLIDEGLEERIPELAKQIEKYDPLFEIGKTFLLMKSYLNNNFENIVIEKHHTEYSKKIKKYSFQQQVKRAPSTFRKSYRNVESIKSKSIQYADNYAFLAPDLHFETTGYWKKLSFNEIGYDKNGGEIHGRTWIQKTLTWRKNDTNKKTICSSSTRLRTDESEKSGFIYTMRCAAHDKDIFKVGLTTRDSAVRANELTRTSSSPDQFLIIQDWSVTDCYKAEAEIHERLKEYRINPRREFFKIDYSKLYQVVREVVEIYS